MGSNAEGWRVVMFSVLPPFPPFVESLLRERGHRLVGILTAPARAPAAPTAIAPSPSSPAPASTSSSPTTPTAGRR